MPAPARIFEKHPVAHLVNKHLIIAWPSAALRCRNIPIFDACARQRDDITAYRALEIYKIRKALDISRRKRAAYWRRRQRNVA